MTGLPSLYSLSLPPCGTTSSTGLAPSPGKDAQSLVLRHVTAMILLKADQLHESLSGLFVGVRSPT